MTMASTKRRTMLNPPKKRILHVQLGVKFREIRGVMCLPRPRAVRPFSSTPRNARCQRFSQRGTKPDADGWNPREAAPIARSLRKVPGCGSSPRALGLLLGHLGSVHDGLVEASSIRKNTKKGANMVSAKKRRIRRKRKRLANLLEAPLDRTWVRLNRSNRKKREERAQLLVDYEVKKETKKQSCQHHLFGVVVG